MKGELISQELRGKVTVKIQDMLPQAKETEKFARAIENQIYERSRTKEEYFDLVASNICYRDISQDWQSHTFRQNVVDKLKSVLPPKNELTNIILTESYIFSKARSKHEYLSMISKVYMYFAQQQ